MDIDQMVARVAGDFATMTDESGEPKPGTVLAEAVTADTDGDTVAAGVRLTEYVCRLLSVTPDVADAVLQRFSEVAEMAHSVVTDIESC